MYLQITTKCNMKCEHCCFKCEPGKGQHMSLAVFRAAIKLCKDYDYSIAIGGGEPTLHPCFNDILLETIAAHSGDSVLFIVTNGTHKQRALLLYRLKEAKVIEAHLSTDQYHDSNMVDREVYDAFGYNDWDCERNERGPMMTGRWAENQEKEPVDCACEDILIQPDGQIRYCGCLDAPIIGNVFDGIDDEIYPSGCYKNK